MTETAPALTEVVLKSRGSTFWLRLKLNFRARLRFYLVIPIPVLGVAWLSSAILDDLLRTHSSGMVVGFTALAVLVSLIVTLLVASAHPPPSQVLVPDQLALSEDRIKVWPRRGQPFTTEWRHHVVDVVNDARAYTLKLGKDTSVSFIIPKSELSTHALALVTSWLHRHGYMK